MSLLRLHPQRDRSQVLQRCWCQGQSQPIGQSAPTSASRDVRLERQLTLRLHYYIHLSHHSEESNQTKDSQFTVLLWGTFCQDFLSDGGLVDKCSKNKGWFIVCGMACNLTSNQPTILYIGTCLLVSTNARWKVKIGVQSFDFCSGVCPQAKWSFDSKQMILRKFLYMLVNKLFHLLGQCKFKRYH